MQNPFQDGLSVEIDGDASGFNQTADGLIDRLSSLEGMVAGLGVALATVSAGALAGFVDQASDWEDQLANIDRVTEGVDIEDVDSQLKDLNSTMPISIDQLGELTEAGGRLGLEGDDLMDFTESVGMLGSVTGIAEERLGDMTPRVLELLDIDPSNINEFGSALVWVGQNAGASEEELLDVGVRAGGAANQAGIAEDEFMGLAGTMLEVSPTSRLAASGLDRIFQAIQDPSMVEEFADLLGVTPDEFKRMRDEDPTETVLTLAETIAEGGEDVDEFHSSTAEFSQDLARLGQNTGSYADLQEGANEQFREGTELQSSFDTQTDTLNSRLDILRDRIHNAAITSGQQLLPILTDLVDMFADAIQWIVDLNEATNGWLGIIVTVSTLVGGLAAAGWGLVSMLGGVGAAMGIVTGAATGLVTVLGTVVAPILAIIAVVALLAEAFRRDFGGIRTRTMEVVETLQEALQPAFEWLRSDGVSIVERIRDAVTEFVERAEPYVERFVDLVADGLIIAIETAADVIGTAFDVISTVITTAWEEVIQPFLTWFIDLWQTNLEEPISEAQKTFSVWGEAVGELLAWLETEIVGPFLSWFSQKVDETLGKIADWWNDHEDEIREIVEPFLNGLKELYELFVENITDALSGLFKVLRGDFEGAEEDLTEIWDRTLGKLVELAEWLYDKLVGNSVFPDLIDDILGVIEGADVKGAFFDVLDEAYRFVTGVKDDFFDAGEGLIDAIVDGVQDAPNAVKNAVEGVVGEARKYLPWSDAKEGPLSDLTASGASIPETIAKGVTSNMGALVSALRELELPDLASGLTAAAAGGTSREVRNNNISIEVHSSDPETAGESVMAELHREMTSGL